MNADHVELSLMPSTTVREVENHDGAVLLDTHQGICFSLNPVGARIWHLLKDRCTIEQIAERVSVECGVARHEVEQDVSDFIQILRQKNLLRLPQQMAKRNSVRWIQRLLGRRRIPNE